MNIAIPVRSNWHLLNNKIHHEWPRLKTVMSPSNETEIKILFSFLISKVPFQLIILQTVYQFLYQIHSNSLPIGSTIIICYSSIQTVSLSFWKFYSLNSAILFIDSNNLFIHLNGSPIGLIIYSSVRMVSQTIWMLSFITRTFFPFQWFSISVSFAFHGHIGKSFSVLVSQSLSQSISHKSFRSEGQFLDSRVSHSVNQPAN